MYTLFIDTHNEIIKVVFYKDGKVVLTKEVETKQNHSVTTMPILVSGCEEIGIEARDIKEILVCNGPGSFTGVRLGVTIAKTLAYTLKVPIKTISSLQMKAVCFSHEEVEIIEREKNGFFLGKFNSNNQLIGDYRYLKNSEFIEKENQVEVVAIDYEKIYQFCTLEREKNPHAVKPLYVKQIEVQA